MTSSHQAKNFILFFAFLLSFNSVQAVSCESLLKGESDIELIFSGKYRPEVFWGDNISLFNSSIAVNCKPIDRVFFARHILDLNIDLLYGRKKYNKTALEFLFSMRNKGIWGNPESIASTTDSSIKFLDTVLGSHRHGIPRHIFWIREAWMRFNINEPIGFHMKNNHEFTIGIFSFQLGRGIALGDAYAVGPELLGFYTETVVDQFAPGARLSGDIFKDLLSYELYASILQNKSATLGDTGLKIFRQEFGRRNCPQRGFGVINYVIAGHLFWYVFDNDKIGSLTLEPYFLYNQDPEQEVEFIGDASSKLGTIGLACEYANSKWEFGFDYAFNLGRQKVKGWDRNQIVLQNRNGRSTFVNSHALVNANGSATDAPSNLGVYSAPHSPDNTVAGDGSVSKTGKTAQKLINDAEQGEEFNGQFIGTVPGYTAAIGGVPNPTQAGVTLDQFYNATNRYRNPYSNQFEGWMIVADAAWWAIPKELKVAIGAGVASGDENPNLETIDGNFTGFIGLQEIYSGKRVRSVFALGGAGKLKRPLSVPDTEQSPSAFSDEVSGFTNLVFTGAGLTWTPDWKKKFSFNPNVLAYWEQHPTKKFDIATKSNSPHDARTFLGVEVNSFIFYNLLPDLKAYFVGSVFIPGSHYCDIRGKPLTPDQDKALDLFNSTGVEDTPVPNIGTDPGVTLNFGFEYNF